MFEDTYREIKEMIYEALIETPMARDIVRKGLGLLGSSVQAGLHPDVWGSYAQLTQAEGGGYSPNGSDVSYTPAIETTFPVGVREFEDRIEFIFPDGAQRSSRFTDFAGVDELRFLVSVSSPGVPGSEMFLEIWRDARPDETHEFEPVLVPFDSPIVPLDEVGLHVTDWHRLDWSEIPLPPSGERRAQVFWWVRAPAFSEDTVGIGLCQVHARGDLD